MLTELLYGLFIPHALLAFLYPIYLGIVLHTVVWVHTHHSVINISETIVTGQFDMDNHLNKRPLCDFVGVMLIVEDN